MINFNKAFDESRSVYSSDDVLVDDLTKFVRKELSLNTLRSYWSDEFPNSSGDALRLIYGLERCGVTKARELARRALNRRGHKVRTNG